MKKPRKHGRPLSEAEVYVTTDALLRAIICRYCHNNPRNIDRIRKAFNYKALRWVQEQKKIGDKNE